MLDKRHQSKRIKQLVAEYEGDVKDIRGQLTEQLKLLEQRTDTQSAVISELQDFYKRRAEVDLEYSKQLDKLVKHILAKHKAEKSKRETWSEHSMYSLWIDLLEDTKQESKTRAVLSDLYSNHVAPKFSHHAEDLQRIARKCREIGQSEHQDIFRVLNELHTAMKTYQLCSAEANIAEAKYKQAEGQKLKFEETCPHKIGASRKHKILEKEFDKKYGKYKEYKGKSLRARNEYLLCIDAANSALHHYFAEDLSDLIDGMDLGLQQWVASLLATVISARKSVMDSEMDSLDQLRAFAGQLDSRVDKQKFIEAHHSTFMLPRRFDFRPHENDDIRCVSAQKVVQDELVQRYLQMEKRLTDLAMENEEVWKTLETAEKRVLELQKQPVAVISDLFTPTTSSGAPGSTNVMNLSSHNSIIGSQNQNGASNHEISRKVPSICKEPEIHLQKRKQDLAETEDFYLQKFQTYLLSGNLMKRLQARRDAIRKALNIPEPRNSPMFHQAINAKVVDSAKNGTSKITPDDLLIARQTSTQFVDDIGNEIGSTTPASISSGASDEVILLVSTGEILGSAPPNVPPKPMKKKRIGHSDRPQSDVRPKLFGGSVEEYIEMTGEEIPLVVGSCVKMLANHGLHHQGVFRVSGSQAEINRFKEAFERGEDPLEYLTDGNSVNSVAGVLKLYFRELREPLFPIYMFDQFTDLSKLSDKDEFLLATRDLLKNLSRSVYILLRYLFAFLNHLSEYADENMMESYNLAICFGPTLLPIPEGKDQVFFHNYVNELVKNLIVRHEEVFENEGGILYEKYMISHEIIDEENDVVEIEAEANSEINSTTTKCNGNLEIMPSIDDSDSNLSYNCNGGKESPNTILSGQSWIVEQASPSGIRDPQSMKSGDLPPSIGGEIWAKRPILSPRENCDIRGVAETQLAVEWIESRRRRQNRHSDEKRTHSKPRAPSPNRKRSQSRGKNRKQMQQNVTKINNSQLVQIDDPRVSSRDLMTSSQISDHVISKEKSIPPSKRLSLQNDSPPLRNNLTEFASPINRGVSYQKLEMNKNEEEEMSPTYLRDIQCELKAVLSSLEQFTENQGGDSSKPDLVLNLPSKIISANFPGTSPNSNPSSATQFAEQTSNTLKKAQSPRLSEDREKPPPVAKKPFPAEIKAPVKIGESLEIKIEKL